MTIFSHRLTARRFRRHGKWPFGDSIRLERSTYIGSILIWRKTIDREEIPAWAVIQLATLGWTEWRSKFYELIR